MQLETLIPINISPVQSDSAASGIDIESPERYPESSRKNAMQRF
jgi:hypothetical protein